MLTQLFLSAKKKLLHYIYSAVKLDVHIEQSEALDENAIDNSVGNDYLLLYAFVLSAREAGVLSSARAAIHRIIGGEQEKKLSTE